METVEAHGVKLVLERPPTLTGGQGEKSEQELLAVGTQVWDCAPAICDVLHCLLPESSLTPAPCMCRGVLVEIGAGSGFCGLFAASKARHSLQVVLTDLDTLVPVLKTNRDATLGSDAGCVHVLSLPW